MGKLVKIPVISIILALVLALLFPASFVPYDKVQAKDQGEERVLRVAFPEVDGFTETLGDGSRHGLVVDYLEEIAKYTGWKYEYIETDAETLIDEFLEGKFDLMGGTYYQEGFEKYFAYPDYNTGFSKSVLIARKDDERIKSLDWRSMAGKTIGVYEKAEENIRHLQEFTSANSIDCELKYYTSAQMSEGNLYRYLESGEVDMLLGNSAADGDKYRVVAEFNSQAHYIVTTPGNQEVLDGLNMALKEIIDSSPNFAEERYNANFPDSGITGIALDEEEREYIAHKKTVSVSVLKNWHPLYCRESEEEYHNGLIPDVLEKVEAFTGLTFTYVYADNYADAIQMLQDGKVDMLGAFLGYEEESADMDLALTASYATLTDIIARNKLVSFPSDGLTGGVLEGRKLPQSLNAADVKYFKSSQEALRAVNRGEIDYFYGLSTVLEQVIQEQHYTNVVPNSLVNNRNEMSFAVLSPAESELLSVMNKAINSLTSDEKETLANQNMVSAGTGHLSALEMVYANPVLFVLICVGVLILLAILLLVVYRARIRTAKMQSSIDRAEASSRAKGEFLSRMSHEIRTPMNAIMGLSDLTSMMEDVPENVRVNLSKIRSSSQYLLSLISDILDMSRIESGMMTIAKEPFSMSRMLDELSSMMTADANRRELEFTVEKEMHNDSVVGDAIRLKQVLTNLISNALKFTPVGGKVRLIVEEKEHSRTEVTYNFRVVDNGKGISEENQKRIFEAFEQVGTNYSKSQGTGLGLSISRTIVQMMGGELKLHSELGKGSEFYFTAVFPIGEAGEESNVLAEEQSLEHMRILLAEDNDLNAEIAIELLKMQGAEVQRAKDGRAAVEIFGKTSPGEIQAILMDIQMPEMDGLAASRAIRKLERPDALDIPIIAMTANSFKEDVDAAAEAGMSGFLTKPVDVKQLYYELRKARNKE